jgi:hypothetical protein
MAANHDGGAAVCRAPPAQAPRAAKLSSPRAQCLLRRHVSSSFSVRLMEERDIECRWVLDATNLDEWASKIDKDTRFLRRAAE